MNILPIEASDWHYIDPKTNASIGPVSLRDLEVLWETNEIDSHSFVWKQDMTEWKRINDIPDLKKKIHEDTYVSISSMMNPQVAAPPKRQQDVISSFDEPQKVGTMLSNKKQEPEDELENLEKKFAKIQQKFKQGPDGLWHVFDPETQQWKTQAEAPSFDILNDDLLDDLIDGLEGEGGNKEGKRRGRKDAGKSAAVDLDTLTDEQIRKIERNRKKAKKQAEKKKTKWYEAKFNSNVYVKGLPDDVTHDEIKEYFLKAGIIRLDKKTGTEKIKIYKDEKDRPKGDALISFMRAESVDLALEMLNEQELRPGVKVYLERAQFEQKGDYVARIKVQEDEIQALKIKNDEDKLLSWDDDGRGVQGLKIVVITNMFTLEEVKEDENFAQGLTQDILEECEAKLGPVQKITIFEHNPLGPVQIKFKDDAAAAGCIELMNDRFFAERPLKCFYWDGKTDYKRTGDTLEDEQRRLEEFGKWIDEQGDVKEGEREGEGIKEAPEQEA